MGFQWYLYNETLDEYYHTGDVSNIERVIKEVLAKGWTLEHKLHFVSDEHVSIDKSKVI